MVLRAARLLAGVPVTGWLGLAALGGALGLIAVLARRVGEPSRTIRAQMVGGVLLCCAALGAARATAGDPSRDPHALARTANGQSAVVRGDVAAEPDLRDGKRILTVVASQVSLDGGSVWQTTAGQVEATVYGPDDWFAPAYGDTVELTGKLDPATGGYTPPGILAVMPSAKASIQARGGGNPVLAWLFGLRVTLAQGIQRSLPEPEASLLIGILLGLKTPVLRARLPLFTNTGTIHLVVPAGLKVSILAGMSSSALRLLGRVPRTMAALLAIASYAALGGGGAAALRAAIMGALLVLAPALGRQYDIYTALALATR
jgi:competence protein ComEC